MNWCCGSVALLRNYDDPYVPTEELQDNGEPIARTLRVTCSEARLSSGRDHDAGVNGVVYCCD